MANMVTNHVPVAMGQVETILPCSSHFFFPTTFFLDSMTMCHFSLCTALLLKNIVKCSLNRMKMFNPDNKLACENALM